MAREPSGTTVEVLCGQPEQNQGARSPCTSSTCMERSLASRIASCASTRAAMSPSRPIFLSRCAMARAMSAGDRSALARRRVLAEGLGIDHSPPEKSPPTSLNLPMTFGRTSVRQL